LKWNIHPVEFLSTIIYEGGSNLNLLYNVSFNVQDSYSHLAILFNCIMEHFVKVQTALYSYIISSILTISLTIHYSLI